MKGPAYGGGQRQICGIRCCRALLKCVKRFQKHARQLGKRNLEIGRFPRNRAGMGQLFKNTSEMGSCTLKIRPASRATGHIS